MATHEPMGEPLPERSRPAMEVQPGWEVWDDTVEKWLTVDSITVPITDDGRITIHYLNGAPSVLPPGSRLTTRYLPGELHIPKSPSGPFDVFFQGARDYLHANPHQRRGQAYMNHLWEIDREAYEAVHGTDLDPYNREERFDAFLKHLDARWTQKKTKEPAGAALFAAEGWCRRNAQLGMNSVGDVMAEYDRMRAEITTLTAEKDQWHAAAKTAEAEVRQLRTAADPAGRMVDRPPSAKAAAMLADPDGYWGQVHAERQEEAERQVAEQLESMKPKRRGWFRSGGAA